MKTIYCLMILLWPLVNRGQTLKPLKIGDRVPDIRVNNVHNFKSGSLSLRSLKGKAVLFDFWATWCSSCIATFPEMEKLQKEFDGQLQIIMVNSYYPDSSEKVKSFLKKREQRTGQPFTLTYALQDSALRQLFPYRQIPHDVWINPEGKVVAITSASEVNEGNISAFLKHGTIDLPTKDDNLLFNRQKPLLVEENSGNDPSFIYRSVITGYKKHLGCTMGQLTNDNGKIISMYVINAPLITLFSKAYREVFMVPINRMIIEAPAKIKQRFQKDSLYCYEITTAPVTSAEIQNYLKEDLRRAFHLTAKNELRTINCYTLKANRDIKKSLSKGGRQEEDTEPGTAHKYLKNMPSSALAILLERITNTPLVDETNGLTIDMEFPENIYDFDIEKLTAFLSSRGFDIKPEKRALNSIVISAD